MPESGIACEVLQQDFPGGFIFIPDKTESEQEAAERVFVIVRFRRLARYPLHAPCHPAQLLHEFRIGRRFVRIGREWEPRKADRILRDRKADFISLEARAISPPLFSTSFERFSNASGVNSSFGMLTVSLSSICSASPVKPFSLDAPKAADRFPVHAVWDAERPVPFNVQSPIL